MNTQQDLRPVLVGESNPYGDDPRYALYPSPDGCSGHRLCRLVLGMHCRDYLSAFDRVNLCGGYWSMREARQMAVQLLAERAGSASLILLGSKVCRAFGVAYVPFTVADGVLLRLPHPSGLCRVWSDPRAFARARAAIASFVPEVAHLLGEVGP